MKVDVVKQLRCLSYIVLGKSAPGHEGIENVTSAVTTNHPENI